MKIKEVLCLLDRPYWYFAYCPRSSFGSSMYIYLLGGGGFFIGDLKDMHG